MKGVSTLTQRQSNALATVVACLVVAGIVLLVGAGIASSGGRVSYNHYAPLPQGVAQLTRGDYIIFDRRVNPSQICTGHGTGTDSIDTVNSVPRLNGALFVVCDAGQTWNDHRPKAVNFGGGVGRMWAGGRFGEITAAVVALSLLPWLLGAAREGLEDRRRRRAHLERIEDQKRQLAKSFAQDEIDAQQWGDALDKLEAQ